MSKRKQLGSMQFRQYARYATLLIAEQNEAHGSQMDLLCSLLHMSRELRGLGQGDGKMRAPELRTAASVRLHDMTSEQLIERDRARHAIRLTPEGAKVLAQLRKRYPIANDPFRPAKEVPA